MITVTKIFEFEAAHHLPDYLGSCRNLHGHSYKMEVEVSGYQKGKEPLKSYPNMIVDFGDLKRVVYREVITKLDHSNLNEHFHYPTAEHMVQEIAVTLQEFFVVERVRLWETSTSYAEWKKEV